MGHVLNKYLITTQNIKKDLIIYNTITCSTFLVRQNQVSIFNDVCRQIINCGSYNGSTQNLNILLNNKIIYENVDLFKDDINRRYEETFNNKRVLSITLLPTEQCNFRCIYCYESFSHGKMKKRTIEQICNLIKTLLPHYQILEINWFGGEPLLALDVIEKLMTEISFICRQLRKPYYSCMTTNGYLLSVDVLKKLLTWHVVLFQITLDGSKEIHNKQRPLKDGRETYDVICNNLLKIKENIKTSTVKFIIRVNVSDDMKASDINYMDSLLCDDSRFALNVQRIFKGGDYRETSYDNYLGVLQSLKNNRIESITADHTVCYAAKNNSITIRANGDICKCTVNFKDPNNYYRNINDLDIASFSIDSFQYCNSHHEKNVCEECSIYLLCYGKGCPARKKQLCGEQYKKYKLLIESLEEKAKLITLEE